MRHWEIIANKLSKAGWTLGWVSAIDSQGRTIWIADAHRDDGKRFVVHADEKLTAFVELEKATAMTAGVEPVFPKKDQAIDYAQNRTCFRSGEIRVLDSTCNIERIISFDDGNRKL
jgi:hypothetical protein